MNFSDLAQQISTEEEAISMLERAFRY